MTPEEMDKFKRKITAHNYYIRHRERILRKANERHQANKGEPKRRGGPSKYHYHDYNVGETRYYDVDIKRIRDSIRPFMRRNRAIFKYEQTEKGVKVERLA